MFGMEQMVKNLFEQYGIEPEKIAKEAKNAYDEIQRFTASMVKSQHDIYMIQKNLLDLQRVNAAKLDALLNHAGIKMTVEEGENGSRIEFKPD